MKKALSFLIVLIMLFSLSGCKDLKNLFFVNNSSGFDGSSSDNNSSSENLDNSPGAIWESAHKRIIIEYNKNQKHKCYMIDGRQIDEYYLKIDENNKVITFYSSEQMKENQIVKTEKWNIKAGSFSNDKVNIETATSAYYNDPDKVITLYNKGRNPANDPNFPFAEAEKIAKDTFKEGRYGNMEYQGIEKRGIYDYYAFYAYREATPNFNHRAQSWIYINIKTGEMQQAVCA